MGQGVAARMDFDGVVSSLEAIWAVFRELIGRVIGQLARRGQGARRVEVEFLRDGLPPVKRSILLSRPSRDPVNLFNLFRCAAEDLVAPAPPRPTSRLRGRRPGQPKPVVASAGFVEMGGKLSPDGRYVAFSSDESGRFEVYVQPSAGGPKRLVSNAGGAVPIWRRDGKELFYSSLDGRLNAVPVSPGPAGLALGAPQPLFDLQPADSSAFSPAPYDVSADGQTFLVVRRGSGSDPGFVVSLNWTSGLKKP